MQERLVMTLTGADRVGIVEEVTDIILKCDGNIDASRMARLGGEFAMLVLITVPGGKLRQLEDGLCGLQDDGYNIITRPTGQGVSAKYAGWTPYRVVVNGADHEGIIHNIARHLARQGVNIESMDTGMAPAPVSGTPLFTMDAVVVAPPDLNYYDLRENLEEVADDLNVEVSVSPFTG
ncbi:MAG: hypothetical protein JXA13_00895 [Anaerolineales bacterium]|nr:hypothetical protein [Anaerolineales bacterium]